MRQAFAFTLCADDYAMTPGVSRGILEALDAGTLSATSVMTTSPWWPESAPALRRHDGKVDIGLHLNLTLGAPLGPMPRLAPRGTLPDIGTLMRHARRRILPLDEVADEIDRQCDRFVEVFGRAPDHVDGHQHVHVLGDVRQALLTALARRGWRPWLRDCADRPDRILARGISLKKAIGLSVLGHGFSREATTSGLTTNHGFAGFSSFDPAEAYPTLFARYIVRPGRSHLVMCHPGLIDDDLRRLDPVVETREMELAFLVSPAFRETLERRGARLTRLSNR